MKIANLKKMSNLINEIITIEERKAHFAKKKKQEESIYDLLGVSYDNKVCFTVSMEEVLLKLIYEVLLPKAQKSGVNQILIPNTLDLSTKIFLQKSEDLGLKIVEVKVNDKGIVDKKYLLDAIGERSLAFICPFVDPLTGSINEMHELSKICNERGIFSFCDASNACGKVLFSFKDINLDMISFCSAKVCAFAMRNKAQAMSLTKYSYPDNADLLLFLSYAKDLLRKMDTDPYACAKIKNEIIEKYKRVNGCTFLNFDSTSLFDQLLFGFTAIESENMAFYLRQEGILVQYLGLKDVLIKRGIEKSIACTFLMMKFDSDDNGYKIKADFEKIRQVSEKIRGISVI